MIWQTYDLKGVSNDANRHQLLSVVAAVHHQGVGKSLNDWALSLAEALCGISAGGVREIHGLSDLNIITAEFRTQKSAKTRSSCNSVPIVLFLPLHLSGRRIAILETKQKNSERFNGARTSKKYPESQYPRSSIC